MRIQCAVCSKTFESLIIDPEVAWREVYTKLLEHSQKIHPNKVKEIQFMIQQVQLIIVGFVTISELCVFPENETMNPWLEKHLEEMQEKIMAAAGFDPADEEDEEDEEEDSEPVEEIKSDSESLEVVENTNHASHTSVPPAESDPL